MSGQNASSGSTTETAAVADAAAHPAARGADAQPAAVRPRADAAAHSAADAVIRPVGAHPAARQAAARPVAARPVAGSAAAHPPTRSANAQPAAARPAADAAARSATADAVTSPTAAAAVAGPAEAASRPPRSVIVSAVAVPLMIATQLSMLAIIPLAVLVIGTFRSERLRTLRAWAAGLAVVYAVPLALWAIGPDRAPSLSKDMHPALAGLVIAAGVGFVVRYVLLRRQPRS